VSTDRKFEDFSIGDYVVFERNWDHAAFQKFSVISGDLNPLHHDFSYAEQTQFGSPIVPLHMAAAPLSAIAGMMFPGHRSLYLTNHLRAIDSVPYNKDITYSAKVIGLNVLQRTLNINVLLLQGSAVLLEAEMTVQVREDVGSEMAPDHDSIVRIHSVPQSCFLVIGALGGIGRSVCRRLAEKGNSMFIQHKPGREEEASVLAKQCQQYGVSATPVAADLEDFESIIHMGQEILDSGGITGLIHTASPPVKAALMQNMAVNYQAMITLLDVFSPLWLAQQKGRVVFIGSSAVEYFPRGWEGYVAAKVSASRYVLAWHKRNSSYGLEGRVVAPGYVQTQFSDGLYPEGTELLLPEQVAEVVVDAAMEVVGNDAPYLWFEPARVRRGQWGFVGSDVIEKNNVKQSSVVQKKSASRKEVESVGLEALLREFFCLDQGYDLRGAGVDLLPGWDSLRHIELMLMLENKLGINFQAGEIEQTKILSELKELVMKKVSELED